MKTRRTRIATIAAAAAMLPSLLSFTPTNGYADALGAEAPYARTVRVTYYLPTGNPMASGNYPYVGAAACSYNYPLGTRLRFAADGWVVTCEDRGLLGNGGWVDVFAPTHDWGRMNVAEFYGDYAEVEVVD